jgi:Hypoxia induced protein conserved region
MNMFLILLLIAAMIATVVMLVRGLVIFLKTTEADLREGGTGPSQSALKQNKAMMGRIMFQGLAILIVIVLLISHSRG